MPTLLARYATPLTTGLFIVSLVSGVALFFHWGTAYFHSMHEILSMVLIAPFVLHIWKNWRAFLTYFKRPPMAIALALSLAGSAAFVYPALTQEGGRRGPPQFAVVEAVQQATITMAAPLFGYDGESLAAALAEHGYAGATPAMTFDEVASASGKSGMELMALMGTLKK